MRGDGARGAADLDARRPRVGDAAIAPQRGRRVSDRDDGRPALDPFADGIRAVLGIAAASAVTIVGLIFDWRWTWAQGIEARVGYRWPWIGAMATGIVLLAFEVVELFLVPFHPLMHPLLIGGSVAIVALTLTPSARCHLLADDDN